MFADHSRNGCILRVLEGYCKQLRLVARAVKSGPAAPSEGLLRGSRDYVGSWPNGDVRDRLSLMLPTKNGQSDQALVDTSKASGAT